MAVTFGGGDFAREYVPESAPVRDPGQFVGGSPLTVLAGDLVDVVGESYRQDALRRVAAAATVSTPYLDDLSGRALEMAEKDRAKRWFRAALIPEPTNKHDRHAVAVYADDVGQIGYLDRVHAIAYQPVFEALRARGCNVASCPAFVTGGTKSAPHYGAELCLSGPKRVVADLSES